MTAPHEPGPRRRRRPHTIGYSALASLLSCAAATAVSLAFAGTARTTAWTITALALSVIAGIAYGLVSRAP